MSPLIWYNVPLLRAGGVRRGATATSFAPAASPDLQHQTLYQIEPLFLLIGRRASKHSTHFTKASPVRTGLFAPLKDSRCSEKLPSITIPIIISKKRSKSKKERTICPFINPAGRKKKPPNLVVFLELIAGFEPATSSLPRTCSTY